MHKGMAVLQTAALQAKPPMPGLELTIVDSKLDASDRFQTTWGQIPVEFVPPVPMAQMDYFYKQHDVLIAPSIWPESYGLVTREALSAGLWVVASATGALADPIRPGENGHVVTAGDASELRIVLEELALHHPTPQLLISFRIDQIPLHKELDQRYRDFVKYF